MKAHRYILVCLIILLLLAGCDSRNNTTIKATKKSIPTIELQGKLISSSISPDMKLLALITESKKGKSKQLLLISLSSKKLIARTEVESAEINWSDDSTKLACITGQDSHTIILLTADGRTKRLNIPSSVRDCIFRSHDSNKILYILWADKKDEIFELNLMSGLNRFIRTIKKDDISTLTAFREKDCYFTSFYTDTIVKAIDVDTEKTLFSMPMSPCDAGSASFSPDSKYISIRWRISSGSYYMIGRVEDAQRLMSHRYLGSYSRNDIEAFYNVSWLPNALEKNGVDKAIIDTEGASTLVNLITGDVDLHDYPARIHWYKNAGVDSDLLVIDQKGIRTDTCNTGNSLSSDNQDENASTDYSVRFTYAR